MRKRVASQPKLIPDRFPFNHFTKDQIPENFSNRGNLRSGSKTFMNWMCGNNQTQNISSPRLKTIFSKESKVVKPSIIELLIAKHKSSSSKLKTPGSLNKTLSTRPATVTSPALITEPAVRTPEAFAVIEEKLQRDTPKVSSCFKNNDIVDNYLLGTEIGKGAYAVVRVARHLQDNSKVAVKIYDKSKMMTPSRKKNAEREVKILEKLDHVNVIKLVKTVENQRSLNLIMEYVNGCSLMAYLKKRQKKRLDESEARRIFRQVLNGLEYCHNLNITHRDVKLENILIDSSHVVKIIDFGFSTCFSNEKKISLFCGTPSYMSPEIVSKQESFGPPSDIWAAGVVLYVLLTGNFPFKAPHSKDLYSKIQRGAFLIPSHLSPEAGSLLSAMLNLDPLKRPSAKVALEFSWFKEKSLGKTQSIVERLSEVPQVRVSLNNTFDQGKVVSLM
jgi:MAP/microtubule affinity-regulating kinase